MFGVAGVLFSCNGSFTYVLEIMERPTRSDPRSTTCMVYLATTNRVPCNMFWPNSEAGIAYKEVAAPLT